MISRKYGANNPFRLAISGKYILHTHTTFYVIIFVQTYLSER